MGIRTACVALAWVLAAGVAAGQDVWQPTEGWFTLHHDAMRTGRTQHSPGVPFDYVWHKEYWDELIAPEAEPIVAEGLVFIGTFKGLLHALDAETGQEKWRADLGGPIRHSPAYADGKVFAAALGGDVLAFHAADGRQAWRFRPQRRGGFAASPAVYKGAVHIGDRAGDLYAIDAADGRQRWKADLGAMILQTASLKDGKLAVAAEDLVPRLFDAAEGRQLWHGPPMAGMTVRGYYPTFWRDLVIWRTEVSGFDAYHGDIAEATEDGQLYRETRRKLGWSPEAGKVTRTLPSRYTPEKFLQEQEFIRRRMAEGKHPRSFYAFGVADGIEPRIHAVGYHASENGYSVPAPPPVDEHGNLYVFFKSIYTEWEYPIRAHDAVGTLDYATGLPALFRDIDRKRGSFPATCDESNNLTIAGDKLYDTHDHVLAYMELGSRRVFNAYSSHAPELWGGVFKAHAPDNASRENRGVWKLRDPESSLHLSIQWNGPAQGAVAIHGDKVWWITGSMVVCLKGTVAK